MDTSADEISITYRYLLLQKVRARAEENYHNDSQHILTIWYKVRFIAVIVGFVTQVDDGHVQRRANVIANF